MPGESHLLDETLRRHVTMAGVRAEIRRLLQHEPDTLTATERLVLMGVHVLLDHQDQLADRQHTLETKASQALRVIADAHADGVGSW